MSPRNDVPIHTPTGLRVLISAYLCTGLKFSVFIRVGVSTGVRCVTDVAVATKKSSSSISSRARLSSSIPTAQMFFRLLIPVTENLTRYGCKLKATVTRRGTKNHLRMTQERLHDWLLHCRVLKTLRALVFFQTHFVFGRFWENGKPISGRF